MDDLISRSALLKKSFVLEGHRVVSYLDVIEAPTAYDVDAVVAELKKATKTMMPVIPTKDAVAIVRKGGWNEKEKKTTQTICSKVQ